MAAPSNRAANEELIRELESRLLASAPPSSPEAIARQHRKNKLTIPERLEILFDAGEPRFEVGGLVAAGVYGEHGDIRSAGVRTVIGRVSGQDCIAIANDSMVKSGTWFPLTIKKILRAQEIGLENHLPLVYLVDSGGLFLPLQHETFPDREHAGRIFYNNARISARGIPQIAAVMGPCVAGGAYVPALCDEILMVQGTSGIYLGGPHLVKAAIGERADAEKLGGASTHTRLSGMADYEDPDDKSSLERVRRLARQWPLPRPTSFPRAEPRDPERDPDDLLDLIPASRGSAYDMREVLRCVVDAGSWEEYKASYGQSLLAANARIAGRVVGIVANQRLVTKTGQGEMQIGGVIYSDSADKAARFVLNCNQKQVPLIFFQDVLGFMVGTRAEQGGIIKDGAKLVSAVSNSRVPKITVVAGNSYGAGNYALCGRAFGPRFMLAWPTARIGVMGGDQAAETILGIQEKQGVEGSADKQRALEEIRRRYEETVSPYYAAAQLWVDAVIDPRSTRAALDGLLAIACREDPPAGFNLGVFQV